MKTPIIIDTDPGIDDVIAITAALFAEEIDVKLITTVGGNVGIENTTNNAVNLVNFLGKDIPVAKGADQPLLNKLVSAAKVHGESGVGGYHFETIENCTLLSSKHAVEELRDAILNSNEPITLVPIGPLTNIALLLKMYPEVKNNIKQIVLMGGAAKGGNMTPVAEFNMFVDPHAAKIVFDEQIKIVMCGLDATLQTRISTDDIKEIEGYGKVGEMVSQLLSNYDSPSSTENYIAIHDLCTIFYLTRPELFTGKRAAVNVVTEGEASGCTITHYNEDGHVHVCLDIDVEEFRREFIATFKKVHEKFEV
ncbi:ribonucleoside hydrolase RihC [Sporosarcina sp. Marseille-Q4943]|uniref:ribonucleoside hydrolase RihC n=1 Tax=Sporosarcina sp. Marseille-Q4943 TaxID=2942204 RepID=UPI00208DAF1B|nr:ribonucleoside hydrolase RihC [Sporosarcina sp. Marseille-Q4943]